MQAPQAIKQLTQEDDYARKFFSYGHTLPVKKTTRLEKQSNHLNILS
jgi:hypothetical protein